MKQLIHSGVLIPKRYKTKGFHIKINGEQVALTPHQEEMAVAWVKKLGTEYVKDPVFIKNFFQDFSKAMEIRGKPLSSDQVDFSEIIAYVEKEKLIKANMSKEEKKKQAQERKALREANKGKYGYAMIDGVKTEVGNYTVEPPSIFMGRGEHPMRGRWKPEVNEEDITLNLSPDAPKPPGKWKFDWQPESMWIARWDDKLAGKEKYIWLSDSSHVKQQKEIEKFDKARELAKKIDKLRSHIWEGLESKDVKKRKVATVAYLIDELKLRVGDEKDPDEADTVGATTLRPSHIKINSKDKIAFDFLGKDSVRWQKEVELPEPVVRNVDEFRNEAESGSRSESTIFEGIRSEHVNSFLSQVTPGLTAKVFRTYYASDVVSTSLEKANVSVSEPMILKKHVATTANLEAAIMLNHKRKPPKNWEESLAKKNDRLQTLESSPKKTPKMEERIEALRLKIREVEATRDYNLRTSLKSYIDPRIYYSWGKSVDFDWKLYYPKTLQNKFSWVER